MTETNLNPSFTIPENKPRNANPTHITLKMTNNIAFRLYGDTRPHCLEIAKLQKGLVLLVNGEEVIEEGVGFGVPVIIYEDRPYFSSSAETSIQTEANREVLTKTFSIDTVSRKRLGKRFYLHDGLYTFVQRRFHQLYTRNDKLTPFLTKLIELIKILGINTEFQQIKPKGKVTVKYACSPDSIGIEVQLSQLDRNSCKEVLILNELGASIFRKYSDTDGLKLSDERIGAWERVSAEEACLSNTSGTLAFFVKKAKDATLLRGRERVQRRYSWAGFCYSLRHTILEFKYVIRLAASTTCISGNESAVQKIDPHV